MTGRIHVGLDEVPESTDVLVIGLGITGAGVALDAASRGLDVVAVDAHDVAFGTSRWSSKLVHGGLRYLAKGQLDVAHESAVERGILMQVTAPHLVHALPILIPLTPAVSRSQAALARGGTRAGDLLRLAARTRRSTLPGHGGSAPPRPSRSRPSYAGRVCADRCCPGTASSRTTCAWSSPWPGPPRPRVRACTREYGSASRPGTVPCSPTRAPARRARSAHAPSSTPPGSGPASWSRRSGCAPAAARTWCCGRRPCPASGAR